eukprot:1018073-Pelagomonas_calceolata.AAC.1
MPGAHRAGPLVGGKASFDLHTPAPSSDILGELSYQQLCREKPKLQCYMMSEGKRGRTAA